MEKDRPTPSDVQIYAEGYLTLLWQISYLSPLQTRKSTEDLELEQRLLLYLDANYTKELSLDSLSKEFGVSRFVLSRIFTEKFHTTFPDYVNFRRLDYARDLLLSTELSVTQIALDA
ncbi:MAG: helix-turn-helix domain-containing protein [Waltera sp.]